MTSSLRIMSYNVRGLKDDREALRRIITSAAPDVLCLQEMPRHPFSDHRIAAFAASVGMLWGGGQRHRMSTTIITAPRVEVRTSGHALYGVPRPQEPRGYAWVTAALPGGSPIEVISTHMSLYGALRGGHAEKLLADPVLDHTIPWAVCGDFNELEDGPAAKVLKRELVDAGPRVNTFPAKNPEKRIDFVYATPSLSVEVLEVNATTADLEAATDHRPLLVKVTRA